MFAIAAKQEYLWLMPAERIKELEDQLLVARASIAELTKANVELTGRIKAGEVAFTRMRRNARQDGNTLREEIAMLQRRRL